MGNPKQPYIQNFEGTFALADVEVWGWRNRFLNAALVSHPKATNSKPLYQALWGDIRPLWLKAEDKYRRGRIGEGEEEGEREGPDSVTWYALQLFGRKVPDAEGFDLGAWFKESGAWPEIETATARTLALFEACSLEGFLAVNGDRTLVPWMQDVIIETLTRWLEPEWSLQFEFKRDESGRIPRFSLYLPHKMHWNLIGWRDGGIKSPLGWEPHSYSEETTDPFGRKTITGGMDLRRKEVSLTFTIPNYDPVTESRAQWEARAALAAKERIAAHSEEMTRKAETLERAGIITKSTKKREAEHFEWLAAYQVEGESVKALAKRTKKTRRAIEEAIERTAQLIGLPLRKAHEPGFKSGRPKKRPDTIS